MKSLIRILVFTVTMIMLFCSCNQNSIDFDSMPSPFGEQAEGTGGDELAIYYEPGIVKIETIPIELIRMVPEADEWIHTNQLTENSEPSLMGHANLYSFLKTFKLDENVVRDEFKRRYDMNIANGWSIEHSITDEDLDIILTYDDVIVNEYFASEFSIVHDGRIYSPAWVYTHSIEEYKAEGIPIELIESNNSMYKQIPFTDEAREALDSKVETYSKS